MITRRPPHPSARVGRLAALLLFLLAIALPAMAKTAATAVAPTIASLSPNAAVAGATAAQTLTITGTNFTSSSVVYFGNQALQTTDSSTAPTTSLTATIPASALARPRTVPVVVASGRSSGGTSNALPFTITPSSPAPTVTTLSPTSAVAGSAAFPLTVTGTNFLNTSVVYFGNTSLTPTAETSTSLTVTVPASAVTRAGVYGVVVSNGPSSGYSAPTAFTVTPANAPTVTNLSPNTAVAGATTAQTLTVTGTNFGSNSVVFFGDLALQTTLVSGTQLTATIPASALTRPRTVNVVVSNGRGSGGTSNALPFTITPSSPAPTVTTLSPDPVVAGTSVPTLTVTGAGFTSDSVVYFGRTALTTNYVSPTEVTAAVPSRATAYPVQIPVTVSNGASSGSSNVATFTVTPPTTQVFYLISRRGGAASAGLAVTYQAAATSSLDLTQPLNLSVATTATTPVTVFTAGPLTLTAHTITLPGGPQSGTTTNRLTYYEYESSTLRALVEPQANNEYAVEVDALGVNLSGVTTTQAVAVTLTLGGQTFTAQTTPITND